MRWVSGLDRLQFILDGDNRFDGVTVKGPAVHESSLDDFLRCKSSPNARESSGVGAHPDGLVIPATNLPESATHNASNRPIPRDAILLVNAHSRKGEELFRDAKRLLEENGVRLLEAHAVKDPKQLNLHVAQAVESGAPMVIVGGGDGSLSRTIDLLVGRDCVFAFLPLGTANSFARTLGIPLDLEGAVQAIAHGQRRRIDLGVIDGDYFVNCAAIGLSPMIGEGIPRKLKRYLGRFGYLLWAAWCLCRFHAFRITLDNADQQETVWATEVRIANGNFLGGVQMIEAAGVNTGQLVVQVVTGRSVIPLIWNWFASLLKLPARDAPVREFHTRKFRIETRPRLPISIDGEVLARTPAMAEVASHAIEVAAPATKIANAS